MSIIIYGKKRKLKIDKSLGIQTCPNCGRNIEMSLAHEKGYYHIYWIPVFPFRGWKFKACPNCGVSQKLSSAEFKALKKA